MVLPFPDILEEIGNGQGLPDRDAQMLIKSTMLMADEHRQHVTNTGSRQHAVARVGFQFKFTLICFSYYVLHEFQLPFIVISSCCSFNYYYVNVIALVSVSVKLTKTI